MKNLEIKVAIPDFEYIKNILKDYYVGILNQTDTYFIVEDGRLKLREEETGNYFIRYYRPNVGTEKESIYHFYPVPYVDDFWTIFAGALTTEIVVKKTRQHYLYQNAKIHLDTVDNLGTFVEIEVVIKNEEQDKNAKQLLDELMTIMNIDININNLSCNVIDVGYRELLMRTQKKTLDYYKNQNKIFWVLAETINEKLLQYQVQQCLFVEKKNDKYYVLQLDVNIKFDNYKYTAWRKLIGTVYNIIVDVLLIVDDQLCTLDGQMVEFDELDQSTVFVDKKYLAKFSTLI